MTNVTRDQAMNLAAALTRDKVGASVLLNALTEAAKPGSESTPDFTATAEQRAKRAGAIAVAKALAITIRAAIRAAGPSGVRSGQLITDVIIGTGKPMGLVIGVVSALEVAGYVRLEGSNTIVSEELYDDGDTQAKEYVRQQSERYTLDDTKPFDAKPLTLDDM